MTNAIAGAVLLGNAITLAADWLTGVGVPNTAGIVGAIIGGITAGSLTIRKLTKSDPDFDRDLN